MKITVTYVRPHSVPIVAAVGDGPVEGHVSIFMEAGGCCGISRVDMALTCSAGGPTHVRGSISVKKKTLPPDKRSMIYKVPHLIIREFAPSMECDRS